MRPDNNQTPQIPQRKIVTPPSRSYSGQHDAVASMTREQLNRIYSEQAVEQQKQPAPVQTDALRSTYDTTRGSETAEGENTDWAKYHTSWQSYYQKYYERYYVGAVQQAHETMKEHVETLNASQQQQQAPQLQSVSQPESSFSQAEAVEDLRSELLGKVASSAQKVRKSRHFVPAISAMFVAAIFVFLQYNSVIMAYAKAYVSPGAIDQQNIIIDPNASLTVSKQPRLIIPKINVDITVDYNATPDQASQLAAMKTSVAYFGIPGANSKPGQLGNVPIAGHSSNDFTDSGNAKFVFALLEQLDKGDTFYLNYQGTRYTYSITQKKIVNPQAVDAVRLGNDKPYATLITCVPLGTANNRLLVIGEQLSPSPSDAAKNVPTETKQAEDPTFTGNAPTVIERLFGAN